MSRRRVMFAFALATMVGLVATGVFATGLRSVTGGGRVITTEGEFATFGITAREMPDGTAKGQVQGIGHESGLNIHIDIDCLLLEYYPEWGDVAWVSGWTKAGSNLPYPYQTAAIVDGGDELPDYITYALPSLGPGPDPSQGQRDCVHHWGTYYVNEVIDGGVTVRP